MPSARTKPRSARNPSLVQAHANLISLYGRAGNFVKAEEDYRTVVALGGDLSEAHYDYGVLLGLQEKWDLAADAYGKALALNPSNVQARNNLGQVLERQRKFAAAADEYRKAVESQPTFRLARFNLGRMLIAIGRNEDAITELLKLSQPQDAETPTIRVCVVGRLRAGREKGGSDQMGHRGQTSRARVRSVGACRHHRAGSGKAEMSRAPSYQLSALSSQVARLVGRAPPP